MRLPSVLALIAVPCFVGMMHAQIPAQEDVETKSHWEAYQSGLEIREVRESAARDLGDALSRTEGISKLRKGGIANDVVLRGHSSNNINLLIDGIRIYGACPGHMDPAAFHVDFAEVAQVEVTKGVFDVANQGSLAGSINVIRKRALPGFHLSPSFQMGSFGFLNPAIDGSAGSERIEVSGGYSFRMSDPFKDGNGQRMTAVTNYRPQWMDDDAYRIHTAWGGLRFSLRENQSGEVGYTRQDGANILYPYLQMDSPYDIADRLHARYEFREVGSAVERIQFSTYYTTVRHWMTDEKRLSSVNARDVFSMATFARTRVGGGRADITLRRGFTAGFEAFQRNWDAVNSMRTQMMVQDQHIIPNVNTTVTGAYADWSYNFTDRLRVGAGARLDTANMYVRADNATAGLWQAYKGTAALESRNTNPSANGRMSYGIRERVELIVGIGSTVRLPDAQERYFNHRRMGSDWVGNPDIRPTRNTEINAGATFRGRRFYFRPILFHSSLSDYIVVHNQTRRMMVPGVMNLMARSYENVDARMVGGELNYGIALGTRWVINGGASYTRGSKNAIPSLNILNTNLPEIPPLRGQSSVRYGTRLWFAEVEGIAVSSQERIDTDLGETRTAGFATMNLKFGWQHEGVRITAGLENLFDRYYLEHLSFQRDPFRNGARLPEPGRNLFLSIGYSF